MQRSRASLPRDDVRGAITHKLRRVHCKPANLQSSIGCSKPSSVNGIGITPHVLQNILEMSAIRQKANEVV